MIILYFVKIILALWTVLLGGYGDACCSGNRSLTDRNGIHDESPQWQPHLMDIGYSVKADDNLRRWV